MEDEEGFQEESLYPHEFPVFDRLVVQGYVRRKQAYIDSLDREDAAYIALGLEPPPDVNADGKPRRIWQPTPEEEDDILVDVNATMRGADWRDNRAWEQVTEFTPEFLDWLDHVMPENQPGPNLNIPAPKPEVPIGAKVRDVASLLAKRTQSQGGGAPVVPIPITRKPNPSTTAPVQVASSGEIQSDATLPLGHEPTAPELEGDALISEIKRRAEETKQIITRIENAEFYGLDWEAAQEIIAEFGDNLAFFQEQTVENLYATGIIERRPMQVAQTSTWDIRRLPAFTPRAQAQKDAMIKAAHIQFMTALGISTKEVEDALEKIGANDEDANYAFRSTRPDENPSEGLYAKDITANNEMWEHVLSGGEIDTQHISATRNPYIAYLHFGIHGATVIAIDLDLLTEYYFDASNGFPNPENDPDIADASKDAIKEEEVIIEHHVNPEAITILRE